MIVVAFAGWLPRDVLLFGAFVDLVLALALMLWMVRRAARAVIGACSVCVHVCVSDAVCV